MTSKSLSTTTALIAVCLLCACAINRSTTKPERLSPGIERASRAVENIKLAFGSNISMQEALKRSTADLEGALRDCNRDEECIFTVYKRQIRDLSPMPEKKIDDEAAIWVTCDGDTETATAMQPPKIEPKAYAEALEGPLTHDARQGEIGRELILPTCMVRAGSRFPNLETIASLAMNVKMPWKRHFCHFS